MHRALRPRASSTTTRQPLVAVGGDARDERLGVVALLLTQAGVGLRTDDTPPDRTQFGGGEPAEVGDRGEPAAQRGHAERSFIFDTANAAGGEALLAIAAAEAAQRGDSPEAIMRLLETLKPQTETWAIAREISHAVRGGRVPRWAKPVAENKRKRAGKINCLIFSIS